jgi:hypothetical protein
MGMTSDNAAYRDRTFILRVIGALLLLVGGAVAFLGPLEMYCFYLFSEGGRFYYEGFGFGSFMFGNIACQIMGYYLIAATLIPLGYGHLRVRRWARPLALALLWFWIVAGVPLLVAFLFVLLASKDLSPAVALAAIIVAGVSYPLLPGLLIRFYRSENVRLTFESRDPKVYWIERLPVPILTLSALSLFYVIILHALIFFNGVFPLFGAWTTGLQGIALLDISILCLAGLIWGTLGLKRWAWWGGLLYFGLMSVSWIVTLVNSSWSDILMAMDFPPREMELLRGIPLQGVHFAVLAGIPLVLTLVAIILARRCFGTQVPAGTGAPGYDS